jgi:aminodeoxyfutalosine synthase
VNAVCQTQIVKSFTKSRLVSRSLSHLYEKVAVGERITEEDAVTLFRTGDLNSLGQIASIVRRRKNANRATYILNRYINYSNICVLSCQFCAFGARKRDPHAFEMAITEIEAATMDSLRQGVTEVHMVGGLHPTLPGEWYIQLLETLRALDLKLPIQETLEKLRRAGLNSLTGGGAEIFDPVVRDRICRGKETAEEWKEVHRIWHGMGERSTCTMLFGHIETIEQRVDHLRQLRELQDETHGFTGFIPFSFVPETTELKHIRAASAVDQLRTLAVSRIYLDNFDHLTGYWIALTLPVAQLSLAYGVDDLHGTLKEEKIFHMAGSKTPQEQTVETLERTIREAGYEPLQRDSYYRPMDSGRKEVGAVVA